MNRRGRSNLSGMFALAVGGGASPRSPVRDVECTATPKGRKGASAFSPSELPDLMKKLRAAPSLIDQDTVELFEFMLASARKAGEACALGVSPVGFDAGMADAEATDVRVKGRGVVRTPMPRPMRPGGTLRCPPLLSRCSADGT